MVDLGANQQYSARFEGPASLLCGLRRCCALIINVNTSLLFFQYGRTLRENYHMKAGMLLLRSVTFFQAFPIVQHALFYEEPMGRHAFGSNVRDAACYVLWAFARAYEPEELRSFVNSVATSLVWKFSYPSQCLKSQFAPQRRHFRCALRCSIER